MHFHYPVQALPAPRQLPPDVPDFVNRVNHLARLHEWLDEPEGQAHPVEVIAGVGGVGKTTLATHWAHRVRDRFPDGDLFVDMHGYHPERSVEPGEALAAVLRALDIPAERIPSGVDARAALYRSLLHRRRMLVLLDDAATPEQVRPLLPGTPTCKVLITSRSHMSGLVVTNGAQRMPLDVLPPERAKELLGQITGAERVLAEPAAVDRLIAYCGYLPLALRIAAERLAERSHAPIAELVEELAVERERLDVLAAPGDEAAAVRAVFSLSYRALTPDQARAYRLLGLPTGQDIGLPAAAALLGMSPGRTRRVLSELTSVHLLTERDDRRYQLHDLLRLHAAECAEADEPEAERRAAVRRLLVWYAHATRDAVAVIIPFFTQIPVDLPEAPAPTPEFADRAAALAWGDAERANLVAAVRQAAATGMDDLAWRLPVLMFGLMLVRRPHADWLATHEIGVAAARACGERAAEAWLLTSAAIAERESRDPERALDQLTQALARWREDGTRWGIAWALRDTGATYRQLGRHTEAIAMLEQALEMHLADGDTWGEATALAGLAKAHVQTGELDLALAESQRALQIRREHQDQRNIGNALNDVSHVHLVRGDFAGAEELAKSALEILTAVDYWNGRARSCELLGDALDGAGRADEAAEQWRAALELYSLLGDPRADEMRGRLAS
ncbi:ATP-binding protein [Actinokineospora sp. NPDC004072]